MMEHPKIIELKSGRAVAMAEYGDANGEPVMFCHGWPSSRTMAQLTDDTARELNLRIISPDRPGIRHSAFHANRKLLDWPPLIAEVADNLGIADFRMLAVSGGAPYALATAWAMPQRVRAISIVSGAPPIADLADRGGLFPLYRWMLFFYRKHPEVLRRSFQLARPFLSVRMPLRLRPLLLKLLQPTSSLARLGPRSDGRCSDLCGAVGIFVGRNSRTGALVAWQSGPQFFVSPGETSRVQAPELPRSLC